MSTKKQTASTPNNKPQTNKQQQQTILSAWHIAYTALWNTIKFSEEEIHNACSFLHNFINGAPNPQQAYQAFVQRVLLARYYVTTNQNKYIPTPSIWFDTENKNGFAGTASWLQNINETRQAIPQYKIALVAFAKAIKEVKENSVAKKFHYWRSYFIQQNKQGLLNLFLSTVANLQNQ
jgi:hypothetical protein